MRNVITLMVLALLAFCPAASAQTWDSSPGVRNGTFNVNCDPAKENWCFYDMVEGSSNLTTPVLNLGQCENWSYHWSGNLAVKATTDNVLEGYHLLIQDQVLDAQDDGALRIAAGLTGGAGTLPHLTTAPAFT